MLDLRAEGLCTKTDLHSSGSALIQCIHVRIDSNCCTNYFYLEADLELLELNFMDYVWHFTYNLKLSTLFVYNNMSSWTGRRAVSNVHIWGKRWHQLLVLHLKVWRNQIMWSMWYSDLSCAVQFIQQVLQLLSGLSKLVQSCVQYQDYPSG